ncbi:hypothetical protein C7974DRAFT_377986 [Boeremia exigua]|uniref:uncharacterized protein n=1 Tax=Boeremia exigua TaxID=749465 RepID=UPI001E8E75AC|nr:uncharacterized protein C7974DRAFT_377986 [Boeremia exigua]KAH6622432.1 hypothetical protein C7974DRAFT_377986 [Boeremia exigua]
MNNIDSHPRLLSLSTPPSSSRPSSIVPTTHTPSPRRSHDSQHDAHHFAHLSAHLHSTKAESGFQTSLRRLWSGVKEVAREHHRSVNAAYEATHGAGAGVRGVVGVRV